VSFWQESLAMNIGPYEIVSEIGRGGMGVVYKAKDPRNGKFVAIKLLTGMGAVDPHSRMGLVREARVTSQLRHPQIVRTYDIGQHKGMLYLVMELLEGHSLDRIVKHREVVPVRDKLNLMIQLCSGLGYAHAHGVLHRDIKPANIFIHNSGSLKIVDFGLARLTEIAGQSVTKDRNTRLAGTLAYMSPELLNGTAADIRSDLWSVGVTLYEMLTYTLPFTASSLGALVKSVEKDPVPPLDISMALRGPLTRILECALAKDPSARYTTAEAFAHDLQALLLPSDGDQLAAQGVLDPDIDRRGLDPDYAQEDSYPHIELGLVNHAAGKIRFQATTFTQSGWLENIKQFLGRADFRLLPFVAFFLIIGSFNAAVQGQPAGVFNWEAFGVCITFTASLVGLFVFGVRRANVTLRRKCRSCTRLRMMRVSKWSRFVTSNTEIGWGLQDCIAALEDGCYEDAAKLLTVHGAENALVYAVIRYNLEFWQCPACTDQCALLIVEDKSDSRWSRRDPYYESYKYSARGSAAGSRTAA
jgi:serine/threonine protein kinase